MQPAEKPSNESARLNDLRSFNVLDSAAERAYDDLTILASQICGTPMALVSLVDTDRQWFKAKRGLTACETSRDVAFCAHAILQADLFIVPDALLDERFADNPLVRGEPHVRFYAGAPLVMPNGHVLGTLCVIDTVPRNLDSSQAEALQALARQVVCQMETRRLVQDLAQQKALLRQIVDTIPHTIFWKDRESTYVGCNQAFAMSAGLKSPAEVVGKTDYDLPWTREESDFYRSCDHRTMSDGVPLLDIEETILSADGIHRNILTNKLPLRSASGEVVGILGVYSDVTDRQLAEDRFRTIFQSAGIGIALVDTAGTIVTPNRAFQNMLGYGEDLGGRTLGDITHPADRAESVDHYRRLATGELNTYQLEKRFLSRDGRLIWVKMSVSRMQTATALGPIAVALVEDVTERRIAEERLRHDSLHDALTGLPNRLLFHDRVGRCLERAKREPDYHFAVLFLDLDRFKLVNDSLGHAAGDKLLTTVAARLSTCLRGSDSVTRAAGAADSCAELVVARMGGDEFTVLLDGLRHPNDAARIAHRILSAVCQPVEYAGQEIATTVSIGIVVGGPRYESEKEILRDADVAMYKAKGAGKNQYAIFDEALHSEAVARLRLETDLRRAIERDELLLHYQPIVSLETHEMIEFEALVRWNRDGVLVNPADFIPIAEETGLIVPIGRWVIEEACRQMIEWDNLDPARRISVSVNVSRKQLGDPELIPQLAAVLAETKLDPQRLTLEITESVIVEDNQAAKAALMRFKSLGVRLSLDDFGTGYSSLSCLHAFPIDKLKVDRSFIVNMPGQRDAAAVIQAVVNLANNLGMKVVAEGLETPEQVALLQTLNCDYGQGYYFSRPIPAEAVMEYLRTQNVQLAA